MFKFLTQVSRKLDRHEKRSNTRAPVQPLNRNLGQVLPAVSIEQAPTVKPAPAPPLPQKQWAYWRGNLNDGYAMMASGEKSDHFTMKYRDEFAFWVGLEHGECLRQFGQTTWDLFRGWQTTRMTELAHALKLANLDELKSWSSGRSAVEIGPGPFPSIAIVPWQRAIAVDPLADGYFQEKLVPPDASRVVFLTSAAEQTPLPSGFADLFVAENCLDHVDDPREVLREATRLLAPGGYVWLLVDLMDYKDLMHPNPFSEQSLHALFKETGFDIVIERIGSHKSHPNAYAQYRCLLRMEPATE